MGMVENAALLEPSLQVRDDALSQRRQPGQVRLEGFVYEAKDSFPVSIHHES
jgi:hypothetical protein